MSLLVHTDFVVYFIRQLGGDGLVKIGHSTLGGVLSRQRSFESHVARCWILGFIPAGRSRKEAARMERQLHGKYSMYREHGEWFRMEPALAEFIAEAVVTMPLEFYEEMSAGRIGSMQEARDVCGQRIAEQTRQVQSQTLRGLPGPRVPDSPREVVDPDLVAIGGAAVRANAARLWGLRRRPDDRLRGKGLGEVGRRFLDMLLRR